jgi:hypothetical protein
VIGNDFDLTNNEFSYKPLKELADKVPEFFGAFGRTVLSSWSDNVCDPFFRLVKEVKNNHAARR